MTRTAARTSDESGRQLASTERPLPGLSEDGVLVRHGITAPGRVYLNLGTEALYEEALCRREGRLAAGGAFVVETGQHTGRSPNDKFIVDEPASNKHIGWGKVNKPFDAKQFDLLHQRVLAYLQGKDLFVQDCFVGADPAFRRAIRVVTETAWHSLFSRTMLIAAPAGHSAADFSPDFTVLHAPNFQADPKRDGTASSAFIIIHFGKGLIIIGGTSYAGEIKKTVFTVMNYLLPLQRVLTMHAAANVGPGGESAVFFGLSGTGKTALSADSARTLIGDDEHGWSDNGVFNFEDGCYAKLIRLSASAEPEIFGTTRRFGTVLENVVMNPQTRELDLNDESLTENTRGAYPITFIPNASQTRMAGHPKHVIMLTCDAFGVMPPIAKLTPAQAMYHFLSGYTAKVAGTEKGITEPKVTFSACFGAPFMALPPRVYAELLGEKIKRHEVSCWLINTGWTGGPYGVGGRIKIAHTRAMVSAVLSGALDSAPTVIDPVFRISRVTRCHGVPDELLEPRATWKDPKAYDAKAKELALKFRDNFLPFAAGQSADVNKAGPVV